MTAPLAMWAAALWLLAAAPEALAQASAPSEEALERGRELYHNGVVLYREGRYEEAILAWQEGYRLTERPGFLFNMANAYERLARYDDALGALSRYRAFAKAEEREALERRMRALEERQREAAAAASPAPGPAVAPAQPGGDGSPNDLGRRSGARGRRVGAGLGIASVGVVLVGVGAGFGLAAQSARALGLQSCADTPRGRLCQSAAEAELLEGQQAAVLADASFAVGGTLALTGLIVAVTKPRAARPGVAWRAGPSHVAVGYRW